ncbi:zonular occludens toxin domain-containing protein [Pyrobaculum sp.]|uniref:zonular occludens toxin domain-containing protein n=1 Tax=Pyrobaculum sp. TaxID=2004705 RepID=UPI003160E0B9
MSQFSVEELAKLYLIAMASVVGEEEKAAFTGVQLGTLRRFSSKLSDLPALIEAISMAADLPEMTRQVLISKLSNFCESYDEYTCVPYKSLTKPLGLPPTPAVIRIDPRNPAVATFVTHAVVMQLLKRPASKPTYIVIDEFHRIMPKVSVEDPVMEAVVAGRHANYFIWISTQSPRHLRRDVLAVFPTQVFFQLREDVDVAASLLSVPPEAITSLRTGEWLAVTPVGRRRWE